MVTLFSIFLMLILLSLAFIHIYWGHGGTWPGTTRQDLIDKVFGKGKRFPPIYVCYTVAGALTIAGVIPFMSLRITSSIGPACLSWANYLVAAIFFIRGAGGYLPLIERQWTEIFVHYNRIIYSPLCIGIAISYAFFGHHLE